MPFEPQMPGYITGSISTTVTDPTGLQPHSHIIQLADPWAINVKWGLSGGFVSMLCPGALWNVRVYLESLGPGAEFEVAALNEPVGASAASHNYDKTLVVAGGNPNLKPGAYKMVTVLTITNNGVPIQMAGFDE